MFAERHGTSSHRTGPEQAPSEARAVGAFVARALWSPPDGSWLCRQLLALPAVNPRASPGDASSG